MGLSCKSKSAIAVCNSTSGNSSSGNFLETFKFRDLEAATNGFARENLILRTSHGHMYRGTLADGRVVAVKRADTSHRSHEEAFENEVQILSKLFSRRLVNLLGCSRDGGHGRGGGGGVKLLVLEFMDNGPLHDNLTHPDLSLSWPMRVKLSVDIAKAIRALHASSPPIVHRNLRCSNVFLDRDGRARLGDFCLAKILVPSELPEPPRRSNLIPIPEMGTEEEYRHSSAVQDDISSELEETAASDLQQRVNPKTDVYSFGILLLEIMSGRTGRDEAQLLQWALPLIKHGHCMAICDPHIVPFPDSAAVRIMASVAARCVRSSSSRRPPMEEVVQCLIRASKLVPEPLWTTSCSNQSMGGGISTPSYPELTPSSSSSRNLQQQGSRRGGAASSLRRKEKLINANLDAGHTPFNTGSTLALWSSGFPNVKKKKTLVFRLGRFLVRKLRIVRKGSSYEKVAAVTTTKSKSKSKKSKWISNQAAASRSPKVSDDLEEVVVRERSIVVELQENLQQAPFTDEQDLPCVVVKSNISRRTPSKPSRFSLSNHRSGKKFIRL